MSYRVFMLFMKLYPITLIVMSSHLAGSPSSGVVDVMVAIGPLPVFVPALTLKVYAVEGRSLETMMDVALASETEISRVEPAPTTCTMYLVMTVLCSPSGKGFQEISADVGSP